MAIKSKYYTESILPLLKQELDKELENNEGFREELFDKLYSFFSIDTLRRSLDRYISNILRSIKTIYERLYRQSDAVLFWKTDMFYYVKTQRVFEGLEIESGS